jgi:(2Fe-2S) ferredoxin
MLTNIAFPPYIDLVVTAETALTTAVDYATVLNNLPVIESVYFGQVTFLDPAVIARVVKEHKSSLLRVIDLTDAYRGSIWGRRVRLEDIENVVDIRSEGDLLWIREIRRVVRCNSKTERIEGGDRMA